MSIQMIALRKDFATFMRQSDVRIGLLREVVEKLQKGEEVDVEKVLGTGDAEKELEWEQGLSSRGTGVSGRRLLTDTAVLREIEREEPAKNQQRKKQPESTPPPAPTAAPTPAPTSEADTLPAQEGTKPQVQSALASKGFF
jgi:pyruvate/2-oxoglutarate dehydrogenase complex dihydrolipoamide acyltransferase (E2) component